MLQCEPVLPTLWEELGGLGSKRSYCWLKAINGKGKGSCSSTCYHPGVGQTGAAGASTEAQNQSIPVAQRCQPAQKRCLDPGTTGAVAEASIPALIKATLIRMHQYVLRQFPR